MALNTLLASRQVVQCKEKRKVRVMRRIEDLINKGILEFVPYSNLRGDFILRDTSKNVYFNYHKISFPDGEIMETLAAAVTKSRAQSFDVYSYADKFRREHFADFSASRRT